MTPEPNPDQVTVSEEVDAAEALALPSVRAEAKFTAGSPDVLELLACQVTAEERTPEDQSLDPSALPLPMFTVVPLFLPSKD